MERRGQGSPLPSDPAGREDIMSDEQDRPGDLGPDEPEDGISGTAGEGSPMSPDPARREDVFSGRRPGQESDPHATS